MSANAITSETMPNSWDQYRNGVHLKNGLPEPVELLPPQYGPDEFFTAEQIARLRYLMDEFHHHVAQGTSMPTANREELEELIQTELKATIARAELFLAERNGR